MNTITFRKLVSKEESTNPTELTKIKDHYESIVLSIDEIQAWQYGGITCEPFGEYISLRIKFIITEQA